MKTLLLALALLLHGCGVAEDLKDSVSDGIGGAIQNAIDDHYTPRFTWSGDSQEDSDNFIVNYDPDFVAGPIMSLIEQWWIEIQGCAELYTDASDFPIIVEYRPKEDFRTGRAGWATFSAGYTTVFNRDTYSTRGNIGVVTRHEMLHILMYRTGHTNIENAAHTHPAWGECVPNTF